MASRGRRHSCPPCAQHHPSDAMNLPNGLTCMMRCVERELCYSDLHTHEDRDYEWAWIERARVLPQITSPPRKTNRQSSINRGSVCECGIRTDPGAEFCWSCGKLKTSRRDDQPKFVQLQATTPVPGEPMYLTSSSLSCLGSAMEHHFEDQHVEGKIQNRIASHRKAADRPGSSFPLPLVAEHDEAKHIAPATDSTRSTSEAGSHHRSMSMDSTLASSKEVTTMMICPIPYEVTSDQLLQAINCAGFAGLYDFVYLPARSMKNWKKGTGANPRNGNVGYAFVNFRDSGDASRFAFAFNGVFFPGVSSEKQLMVTEAACQGYESNLSMHMNKKRSQGSLMTFTIDEDKSFGA